MNALEVSTKQFFIIIASTVAATVTVFAMGLLSGSLIADQRMSATSEPMQGTLPLIEMDTSTPAEPLLTIDTEQKVPFEELPAPNIEPRKRYGIQVAVFSDLDNALQYAVHHKQDEPFTPRVFSRQGTSPKAVYPVLVGVFDTMEDAQQAKRAYQAKYSSDSFVTDASLLQDEIMVSPAIAMVQ